MMTTGWLDKWHPGRGGTDAAEREAVQWIDLCARRLAQLRPDAPPAHAVVVASHLWINARDMHPHDAAAMRSLTWH